MGKKNTQQEARTHTQKLGEFNLYVQVYLVFY